MNRIQYAGNTLVTGSAIAHAVLAYAQALSTNGDSATVTIPVRHEDGSVVTAELLIGPASQLISEPQDSEAPELEDEDVLTRLHSATAALQTPRAVAEATADFSTHDAADLDRAAEILEE